MLVNDAQADREDRHRFESTRVIDCDDLGPSSDRQPTAHLDHASATLLAEQVLREDGRRAGVWITHEPIGLDRVDTVVQLHQPRRDVRTA